MFVNNILALTYMLPKSTYPLGVYPSLLFVENLKSSIGQKTTQYIIKIYFIYADEKQTNKN